MSERTEAPDFPLETSIPEGGASLESILCGDELHRRPSRPPDYGKENRALVMLVSALADSPGTIFHTLAETILEITQCDSAGLSLLTRDGKTPHVDGRRFYWPAIAGMWCPHIGGGTPRNFGPCGDVLDQSRTLLFQHFERRYPYLLPVIPAAEECLVVPFHVAGQAVGTIWGIMHTDRRKFDAEDERLMNALGQFASAAYQTQASIEDLRVQIAAREHAEDALQTAEQQSRSILESALDAVVGMNTDGVITGWNKQAEEIFGWTVSEAVGRRMSETIIPATYRSSHETGLRRFFATGQGPILNQRIEITALRRDGSEFPVELTVTPLKSGDFWTFSSFIRDISERRRSEEQLRASEISLRTMIETIPGMLWSATPDGAVDYCNARVLSYTGLSQDQIKGAGWVKAIHPDDADRMARAWALCVENGNHFQFDFRCLRASDAMYRWSSRTPCRCKPLTGEL